MSGVNIKICGLSRPADIDFVNDARPDFIGFVFAESRRRVTPDAAAALRERLDPGIVPVGVFVDAAPETAAALANRGVIGMIQLNGGEDAAYIRRLRTLTAAPVIQAVRVRAAADVERALTSPADFLLLDSGGGSGRPFDWAHAAACTRPYFLAGGVHTGNIDQAAALRPFAVDVSSGAETDGIKDRDKILELVRRVRHVTD